VSVYEGSFADASRPLKLSPKPRCAEGVMVLLIASWASCLSPMQRWLGPLHAIKRGTSRKPAA